MSSDDGGSSAGSDEDDFSWNEEEDYAMAMALNLQWQEEEEQEQELQHVQYANDQLVAQVVQDNEASEEACREPWQSCQP
jgi:hypothetical protein